MSGFNVKAEKIGEFEFQVSMLPSEEGFPILMKLTQIFGMLGTGAELTKVVSALSPNDLNEMISTFAKHTRVKSDNGNVVLLSETKSVIFAGRYDLMLKWLIFCVEVNFSNFFGGFGDMANDIGARLQRMFGKQNSPIL